MQISWSKTTKHDTSDVASQNGAKNILEPLSSDARLKLQTQQAAFLVRGKQSNGRYRVVGLLGFADRVRLIWHAAAQNDPLADWWLIRIEEKLATVDEVLDGWIATTKEALERSLAIQIAAAESKKPYLVELRFGNPYAYQAAHRLAKFDQLVRDVLTSRHVGVIQYQEAQDTIQQAGRPLRSLFELPRRFKFLGFDRSRPDSLTSKKEELEAQLGQIPEEVLKGERRGELAPRIQTTQARRTPKNAEVLPELTTE